MGWFHKLIDAAVTDTLEAHSDLAAAVRAGTPKAWGALAAHGTIALRARLGRTPTDPERRALWASLWATILSPTR